ncbi:MAG: GntR family transcriptional regulator [Lachnospiraceae bacterium]|jgi:DNA-binding GntR family transcriptional regulator|nr:GntR family transcriptional regulator [Lachnospiraceae bacterium]
MPYAVFDHSSNLNLKQTIYRQLREDIFSIRLVPGEKLSEVKLASQYGCSRVPVREALHQLRLEGCIDLKPQVGSFISYIDYENLEQVRYVRECLETQVMLNALQENAYGDSIEELQSLLDQQWNAYKKKELILAHQLDDLFHLFFLKLPHKEFVRDYMGANNVHYQRARFLALKYDPNPEILVWQHQAILDAVVARDETALKKAIHIHLNNLYRVIDSASEEIRNYIRPKRADT